MKNKFIKLTAAILALFGITALLATPTFAAAGDVDICSTNVDESIKAAYGCPSSSTGTFEGAIEGILYAIIGVSGLVAVIFIVIGGVNYMTSGGDAGKLQKAKNTILYACIGLVICVLAFAITNWTIGAIKGNSGTPSGGGDSSQVTEPEPETNE